MPARPRTPPGVGTPLRASEHSAPPATGVTHPSAKEQTRAAIACGLQRFEANDAALERNCAAPITHVAATAIASAREVTAELIGNTFLTSKRWGSTGSTPFPRTVELRVAPPVAAV